MPTWCSSYHSVCVSAASHRIICSVLSGGQKTQQKSLSPTEITNKNKTNAVTFTSFVRFILFELRWNVDVKHSLLLTQFDH